MRRHGRNLAYMSIIPAALLSIAVKAAELIMTRLAFRRKVEPIPFGRRHHWSYESIDSSVPPHCVYCLVSETTENEDAICPGPKK